MTSQLQVVQLRQYSSRCKHACPKCGDYLSRIPRRSIDRAFSAFFPVQRFRCHFFSCHWEGNVRLTRQQSAAMEAKADSTNAMGTRASAHSTPRKVPRSFVINMCLTGAGLVAVFVFSTTELLSDPELTMAERRKNEVLVTPKIADRGIKIARPVQALAR